MANTFPYFIVLAITALLPAYTVRFPVFGFPVTLLEIALLSGIAGLIYLLFERSRELPNSQKNFSTALRFARRIFLENRLLAVGSSILLTAAITSVFVAPESRAALGILKAYFIEPMLFAWLLILLRPEYGKIKEALMRGLAISGTAVVVASILQYLFPSFIPITWAAERRVTGPFPFPNALALFLAPITPFFVQQTPYVALVPFFLLSIILAKSAGGLIAVLAAFFFLGITYKKLRMPTIALGALVCILIFTVPNAEKIRNEVLLRDWSGLVHKIGWQESIAMLKDNPIFGAGLSGFPKAVVPYHHAQGIEIFQYPHNIVLAVWSELGALGLIGFGCIIAWWILQCIKKRDRFFAAALVAFLVHGLVDVPYFKNDLSALFWILTAVLALKGKGVQ